MDNNRNKLIEEMASKIKADMLKEREEKKVVTFKSK